MHKEEEHNELKQKTQKMKEETITELGAIDFHFQVPKFEHPLMLIPAILNEIGEFGSALQEFHTKKIEAADNLQDVVKSTAFSGMFSIWNAWNAVIGMIVTCGDPEIMASFNEMMKDFGRTQILKSKEKKGN